MAQRHLEDRIMAHAISVTNGFLEAARKAHNEAELRTEAAKVIEHFAEEVGLQLHVREEYTLFNGRADAVYNRFIIEYEPPRSLRQDNNYRANRHAVAQVKQYMTDIVRRERQKEERLAGVAFDGCYYIFVRRKEGVWYIDDPLEVRPPATDRFLRMLSSLSTERALIPENLIEDFGERTLVGRQVVGALYKALTESEAPRIKVLFEQWSRQFSEVCDYDQASKVNVMVIAREYGITGKKIDPFCLFFCIHSYYAALIKLLAVQIAHFYLAPKLGTDLHQAANLSAEDLLSYAKRMEQGGIFAELGIKNFLEGDFFSWYLDCWSPPVEAAIRTMIGKLADYSLVTLDVDPDATRDLLKHLYQHLMPKTLRHNLGEYYTPDWLAERLLNMLDGGRFKGDPKKRLLDPACGSGTFLVLAIKAVRQYGWKNSTSERDVLEMILENIVGFDLNPLAVISARTNYLLALGDLLQHRQGEITIPVYLCDSILTPSESGNLFSQGLYTFSTAVGPFAVPSSLVEARHIDRLAGILEESVAIHRSPDEFAAKAIDNFPLNPKKDERDIHALVDLYKVLLDLDEKKVNGVWARIVKNAFAPMFVGQFDYVAGNPPWVNWEHLPERYRKEIVPLWQRYNLFTHTGLKARLGSAKDDISVLMFYVSADKYLSDYGRIGFVITQTVFKTEGGGEGFRRFKIGKEGPPLRVFWFDDMSALKPFEGATNRTGIVLAEKGAPTKYPVNVGYWRKRKKGGLVPEGVALSQVTPDLCSISQWQAEPIDGSRIDSPWIAGRPKSIRAVKHVVGASAYKARAGCCTWLNGAYWVEIAAITPGGLVTVANCGDVGKKEQENIQKSVESKSVFSLLRGQDVSRWSATPSLSIILAQDPKNPAVAMSEAMLKRDRPKTLEYFQSFENQLRERSGYKKYLRPNGEPFYAIYNVGPYTFSGWKVVWREVSNEMDAAVVGPINDDKPIVPDHTIIMIPTDTEMEAQYLCAVLNCSPARYIVQAYVAMHPSPHVLKYIPLMKFDGRNPLHKKLADSSKQAHAAAARGDMAIIEECELHIDDLAAELWKLSKEELKDIQDSLKDLTG